MKHPDGSIITQFFQTTDKPTSGDDIYDQGLRFAVGQVEKIYYVDDASNVSKKFVEYDVSVRDAKAGQSVLRNLRKQDFLGGANDYDELVLEPNEFAFKGKLETSNLFTNKNGTTVLLAFIDGSKDKPVIVGALQHPRKDGAKRSDGIRRKGEFRGIQWELSKDGELTITYQSNRGPDGKFKRSETGPTVIKIDKTGALSIRDNENQLIKMDRVSKSVQIVTKENYLITVGKDMSVSIVGNSTRTVGGNESDSIQGNTNRAIQGNEVDSIQGNSTRNIQGNETATTVGNRVHSAANHTLTGGGNIKIGSAGASEPLVLGNAFKTLYNAHTHIGNLGVPTGVPISPMSATQLSSKNFTE